MSDDGPRGKRWPGDDETKPAPSPLIRVQALVNTVELPDGDDRLADSADARPWLVQTGLLNPETALQPGDLQVVREFREAIRAMLVGNAGGPRVADADLAPLRAVAEEASARTGITGDGEILLSAAGDTVRARLLGLLLVIRDAQRDGTWARLKACGNDECRWAFYDRSRNHGGAWCDMSTCGNKLKNRDFRARRKATG